LCFNGEDIKAVLEENEIEFSGNSGTWAQMTNLIAEFAQDEDEEELPQAA
jgi:hypothetical protein